VGFAAALPTLCRRIARSLDGGVAVLLRLPCPIGDLVRQILRAGRPYAVEMLGDPFDAFAYGGVKHAMRPILRRMLARNAVNACRTACAVGYVTERSIQRRYPAGPDALSTSYSDLELDQSAVVSEAAPVVRASGAITLVMVGSLEQLYKGPDVLIDALASCVEAGLDVRLRIVGGGRYRVMLERQARNRGVAARVAFLGQLASEDEIRSELDAADVFVLPSRAEGLPKALIEAMARAKPCIASAVGGIPELLPDEDLVLPGDVTALANKIRDVVANTDRMTRMAVRNLERVAAFRPTSLQPRRVGLYRHLEMSTRAWLTRPHAVGDD